jgi:hypothetical protein
MKCPERVEEEDKAQNDPNDLERLAFDEHADDVVNDIEDKSRDK